MGDINSALLCEKRGSGHTASECECVYSPVRLDWADQRLDLTLRWGHGPGDKLQKSWLGWGRLCRLLMLALPWAGCWLPWKRGRMDGTGGAGFELRALEFKKYTTPSKHRERAGNAKEPGSRSFPHP